MKKIIFLILISFVTFTASTPVLVNANAATANQTYCTVWVYLQTSQNWNSTVTYHNGSKYVTEPLAATGNCIYVTKGTAISINLCIMEGGMVYATDSNPSFEAAPITNGYSYIINDHKEISIRVENAVY